MFISGNIHTGVSVAPQLVTWSYLRVNRCPQLTMSFWKQMDYMDSCGVAGKSKFDPESTLKNILAKYDTIDGRLSLKGFIQYYRDIAAQDPRQVSFSFSTYVRSFVG